MTPRERMIAALERKEIKGLVPHFELEFFLTMEAFGKIHPSQRHYHQWTQMSETERDLHRKDIAELYVQTVNAFGLSGLIYNVPHGWNDEDIRQSFEHVRKIDAQNHILCLHGDATYGLPNGDDMMQFVCDIAEKPQEMKDRAQQDVDNALQRGAAIKTWGLLDVFALCADYCFNNNPFLSPALFDEFVTPYLKQLTRGYREMGFYVIKHTDGNIMPIIDALVSTNPHALHSLDPQGGVDIADVKKRFGDKVCLIGNVNCAALQTGTDAEVTESARYALKNGMPGGGYIFGTSNCIYTGMKLERYRLMLDVWHKEGVYK
ncbi:MAG: uroporphyrinogen decarboxylase family protein [Chitinivibrionales bacterium]|nr:uroporphyrinogen decarboxylase family protein [Chitinivibrionales bacterium]